MPRRGASERGDVALRLTLLGTLQATDDLGRPLRLPTRKTRALLAYLALPAGTWHTRERLSGLLWGRSPDDRARNSLRQCVFSLRRALEPLRREVLIQDGSTLALAPAAVQTDVSTVEALAARATRPALEEAAELCDGELLQGFSVPEPTFEEWLAAERERTRELMLGVLERLLDMQTDAGAALEAIRTANRLLRLDPLREGAHRALMRLYADRGQRAEALRQYRTCETVLARELGVVPELATRRLREEILPLGTAAADPVAGRDPDDSGRPSIILVVEDEPASRAMIAGLLEAAGYDVVAASDGRAALEELGRRHFDLVLSDVRMPSIDGFTLLEAMRRAGLDTPAMFLTSGTDHGLERRGLALGARDYVRKPVDKDVLLLRVENVLGRRR